jgi:hypothetical protein
VIFVGVDPKRIGAVASMDEDGAVLLVTRFIETDTFGRAALSVADHLAELGDEAISATLGSISDKGSQQFQAARVYGECVGAVVLSKAMLFRHRDASWYRDLDLPKRYLQPTFKRHLREAAQDKWKRELTIAEADALWLAEWGRKCGPWSERLRAKK